MLMNMNYLLAGTVSINPIIGMFALFLSSPGESVARLVWIAGSCPSLDCPGNQEQCSSPA